MTELRVEQDRDPSAVPPQTFSYLPGIPPPIRLSLITTGDHVCPYLPNRTSSNRAFWAEEIPSPLYQSFMDAGFRRSGKVVYQPICRGCRQCLSIRVPVAQFMPSKSQRRAWRKNADLIVTAGEPAPDQERFELYRKYVTQWHGKASGDEEETYQSFVSFLYESPVETVEYQYRDNSGRLLGVGICDVSDTSMSSVYFYYDPAVAFRSLGTFSALYEIAECQNRGMPHYYLGYWVDGCATMAYKASYKPHEVLELDGVWRVKS